VGFLLFTLAGFSSGEIRAARQFHLHATASRPVLAFLFLGALDASAQATSPGPPSQPATREVVDEMGRTVRIPLSPSRIVSLARASRNDLRPRLAGSLVGDTDFCDYPVEAQKKPKVGGIINPISRKLRHSIRTWSWPLRASTASITVRALDILGIPSYATTDSHSVAEIFLPLKSWLMFSVRRRRASPLVTSFEPPRCAANETSPPFRRGVSLHRLDRTAHFHRPAYLYRRRSPQSRRSLHRRIVARLAADEPRRGRAPSAGLSGLRFLALRSCRARFRRSRRSSRMAHPRCGAQSPLRRNQRCRQSPCSAYRFRH